MPALNFKKRFRPRVESGEKTHSIRAKRKRPWKVGDDLALYTGMRQKGCTLIGRTKVTGVQDISMDFVLDRSGEMIDGWILIDSVELSQYEAEAFARRDGFTGIEDMAKFWFETHELPFDGDVIHWKFPFEVRGE